MHAFTWDDLPRVLQWLGEVNALTHFHFPIHPGDFCHRLSNGLRGQHAEQYNFLYEQNGEFIALLFTEPNKEAFFEVLIHPQHRTAELESALIAWAEQTQQAHFGTDAIEWVMDVASDDTLRQEILTQRGYRMRLSPI